MGLNTTPQILLLIHQQQTDLENIVGKGEIARNEQFLPFLKCFLLMLIIVSPFVHIFAIISLFAAELEEPKIGISFSHSVQINLHSPCRLTRHDTFCRYLKPTLIEHDSYVL